MMKKIAVLGAGNMGCAIVDGILSSEIIPADDIILVRRNTEKLSEYRSKGCTVSNDVVFGAREADVIILAVKPQMMDELFENISYVCKDKLVISIAAGVLIRSIERGLPENRVIRVMPNTPLTVGEGVSEICRGENVSDEEFSFAKSIFSSSGYVMECKECEINALTALTSSAVAYFALVEKAMCDWAMENGLFEYGKQGICDLISKTAIGSAKLMFEKRIAPEDLIRSVASPKGTTEKALDVFETDGLEETFAKAMTACLERAKELSSSK